MAIDFSEITIEQYDEGARIARRALMIPDAYEGICVPHHVEYCIHRYSQTFKHNKPAQRFEEPESCITSKPKWAISKKSSKFPCSCGRAIWVLDPPNEF